VSNNQFSVRWSGQVQPLYAEQYTFYVYSDDGAKLTVNGQVLFDFLPIQGAYTRSGTISLTAGQKYDIKLEYAEGNGNAFCKLEWQSASQMRQVIPKAQLYSRGNPSAGVVTAYADCNYGGFSGGLEIGDYTLERLKALGILDNDISSVKVSEGYKAILYTNDNFSGQSLELTANRACLTGWNDMISSIRIKANGVTNLAGAYTLQNRNSNLFMDVVGGLGGKADGVNIQQWNGTNQANQQFQVTHLGDGVYKIVAKHSNKALDVQEFGHDDATNVRQWTYHNSVNQQFIIVASSDGYYKLIAKHSGKVVDIANGSTAPEANAHQWSNTNQTSAHWKLNPVAGGNGTGNGLQGDYFNGKNFEIPRLRRVDSSIEFDWGVSAPDALVNANGFSVRWMGQIQPRFDGTYTFYLNSDNGRRLWVNDQLIIDKWISDWGTEYTGTISLTGGQKYTITLEYFEDNGGANCKLEWSSSLQAREVVPQSQLYATSNNGDGLTANYYNGRNFDTHVITRKDITVNFNWGTGSPAAGVHADKFSVRWIGQVQPRYSETYTFYVNSDNGRRLWVNNQLIIDKWIDDWGVEYSGTISLTAGQRYDITLEYFENNGGADCRLGWSSASQVREIVPQSQLYSASLLSSFAARGYSSTMENISKSDVYPNPTSDKINVTMGTNSTIVLYNSLGNEMLRTKKMNESIDVRHFPAGVYLIKIDTGGGIITRKIVKE
jgi:hypothetical protein